MAASGQHASYASYATRHRRQQRRKYGGRLQQALFMIDLQFKGIRESSAAFSRDFLLSCRSKQREEVPSVRFPKSVSLHTRSAVEPCNQIEDDRRTDRLNGDFGNLDAISLLIQRVNALEATVLDVQWSLCSLGSHCYDFGYSCSTNEISQVLGALSSQGQPLRADAPEFKSRELATTFCPTIARFGVSNIFSEGQGQPGHLGDFRSLPTATWKNLYMPFSVVKCAGESDSLAPSVDEETNEEDDDDDDANMVCSKCQQPFGPQYDSSYEGDACDWCGTYQHTSCLNDMIDDRGELSLCDGCVERRGPSVQPYPSADGIQRVDGQKQGVQERAENEVENRNVNEARPTIEEINVLESPGMPGDSSAEPQAEDKFEPLNTCIEYIIRFLEGEHMKSSCAPQSVRNEIWERVKNAFEWRREARSHEEIQNMVSELNAMMGNIVKRL